MTCIADATGNEIVALQVQHFYCKTLMHAAAMILCARSCSCASIRTLCLTPRTQGRFALESDKRRTLITEAATVFAQQTTTDP